MATSWEFRRFHMAFVLSGGSVMSCMVLEFGICDAEPLRNEKSTTIDPNRKDSKLKALRPLNLCY